MKKLVYRKVLFFTAALVCQIFILNACFANESIKQKQVLIQSSAFQPQAVLIPVGGTVTWTNKDSSPHTITSNNKMEVLKSEQLAIDESYSHTFTRPGIYAYFCSNHPKMVGRVIVQQVNSKNSV
jgi:plastocyanin